jgi:hypothetical protein
LGGLLTNARLPAVEESLRTTPRRGMVLVFMMGSRQSSPPW